MRLRRHVPVNRADDFEVFSDDAFLTLYNTITGGIVALMMLISSIALLVGGIGVMNIMLVAVTERTREIGLRMAVGATASDIRRQFLLEAALLATAGGVVGVLIGAGAPALVKASLGFPAQITPAIAMMGLGLSTAVGLVAGYLPARNASNLPVVDALRDET
jgi:putative ABC transport system permease protein